MQVAPAHPFRGPHPAEHGVGRPRADPRTNSSSLLGGAGADGVSEGGGWRAPDTLVNLGRRSNAGRPLSGEPKGEPFEERCGEGRSLQGETPALPSGQQNASVRWQTAWWALIEPHTRVSVGLRRAMRLRMAGEVTG